MQLWCIEPYECVKVSLKAQQLCLLDREMEEVQQTDTVEKKRAATWDAFVGESKKVGLIALPMLIVTISQYLSRIASMMMVGHLGEVSLSGTSIATSLTNAIGFSILMGMASALETLCGQAYGAGLYQKLGIYTYGAIISLFLVSIPIIVLWIFTEKLLILMGQDHLVSAEAGRYAIWQISALFPYAIVQALTRYLQSQSLILPMLISSVAALCIHLPICWALVFHTKLGNAGAALAIGLSYWLNVIFLVLYVKYSAACEKTRISFSRDVFYSMKEYLRFAVPSAAMVCLEWSAFEIVVFVSGLLHNPKLEASVLSICLLIATTHYYIPDSLGSAVSTRVSNELGAGNPKAARGAVRTAIVLSLAEMIIATAVLISCRGVLGYSFSGEKEVVNYVKKMTPLVCLIIVMDCIHAIFSGVARGCGWQKLEAYINIGAYYLVGLPVAIVLGFVCHLKGKGLWIGLNAASVVKAILLSLLTGFTNWEKQALFARERMFDKKNLKDSVNIP